MPNCSESKLVINKIYLSGLIIISTYLKSNLLSSSAFQEDYNNNNCGDWNNPHTPSHTVTPGMIVHHLINFRDSCKSLNTEKF